MAKKLTARQSAVIDVALRHRSMRRAADELGIRLAAVQRHLRSAERKGAIALRAAPRIGYVIRDLRPENSKAPYLSTGGAPSGLRR